jgi:hypothetical protein
MNVKSFLVVVPLLFLTACAAPPQKTAFNPDGLNDRDLVQAQLERILKLERDMERRENELKYQHMKELTQVQMQSKARSSECRFLCF